MSTKAIDSLVSENNANSETGDHVTHELIAIRAYEIFQSRGAIDGADMDDWLQAEKEVLQRRSQPR
jgi:hypothetical protein